MTASTPRRFPFIDGLRGMTAFYVVLHHASEEVTLTTDSRYLSINHEFLLSFFSFGHWAVDVFIVISGYCIFYPWSGEKMPELRGGWKAYALRRIRRIVPR